MTDTDRLDETEALHHEMLLGILRASRAAALSVLSHLEQLREEELAAALDFCAALEEIRSGRLYRPETFEQFCQRECGFGAGRARQLGAHLKRVKVLVDKSATICSAIHLPENEGQSRELARAGSADDQLAVLKALAAEGGEITAARIQDKVEEFRAASPKEKRAMVAEAEAQALLAEQQGYVRQGLRLGVRLLAAWQHVGPELEPYVERMEALLCEAADAAGVDRPKLGEQKKRKAAA